MTDLTFPTTHTSVRYEFEDESNYHYPDEWKKNFTWTGREDYLAWVSQWKVRLKLMIAGIRAEKAIRRDPTQDSDLRSRANIERQLLRIDCYNLLLLRKIAKRYAGRQREQNKIAA